MKIFKVTINSQLVPSIPSAAEVAASSPPLSNLVPLLSISPADEIVFTKNLQGDLTAKVQIQNISAKSIAFKVYFLIIKIIKLLSNHLIGVYAVPWKKDCCKLPKYL